MKKYYPFAFLCFLIMGMASCSQEADNELVPVAPEVYTYAMQYDSDAPSYDATSTRASKSWSSGSKVYLRIASGGSTILGTATYDGSAWTLATDASLSGSGTCTATHIASPTSTTSTAVQMDAFSAIYTCTSGTWNLSGNTLTLRAYLTPAAGRIRLKGTSGTSVSLVGLTTYTAYNISTGNFTTSTAAVATSIQSSGYTPYIYGTLTNADRTLTTNGYTMTCPSGMMAAGTSGWLNYPTSTSHTGWSGGTSGGGGSDSSHEYVDLGLPSGTLWATCNVGAENPEDAGLYFAWGETTGYTSDTSDGRSFNWSNYKWMVSGYTDWKGCTKYTFADNQTSGCWYNNGTYVGTTVNGTTYKNLTELLPEDDAATVNWGSAWCMPTHAQQQELVNSSYTTTTWTTQNGVYGRKITSNTNGKSIFLPAAGYRYDGSLGNAGSYGYFWSRSLYSDYSDGAWGLYFNSGDVSASRSSSRYYGQGVRPVRLSASE